MYESITSQGALLTGVLEATVGVPKAIIGVSQLILGVLRENREPHKGLSLPHTNGSKRIGITNDGGNCGCSHRGMHIITSPSSRAPRFAFDSSQGI